MSKTKVKEPKASTSDLYLEALRKTLEHISDVAWLEKHSPLNSVYFTSGFTQTNEYGERHSVERPDIDSRLRNIWREWREWPKIPLQALIWDTLGQLPHDNDTQTQAILLLTYFDLEEPKQSEVVKRLAIGRSTYYRYLDKAIEALGSAIVKHLRPALKLERPQPKPLFGRDIERRLCRAELEKGGVLQMVGGSGIGKTALAASLADEWAGPVFWYTFRSQISDSLEQLIFALAFFFHQHGQSNLWIHLSTHEHLPDYNTLLMIVRQNVMTFEGDRPLFCFDEVDLLLPAGLTDSEVHLELRGFFEAWSQLDVQVQSILLVGQKLLLEPEPNRVVSLGPIEKEFVGYFFDSPIESEQIIRATGGNPLFDSAKCHSATTRGFSR